MTWSDALAPLRNRNFAWYYGSRFSDTLGTMMAGLALTFAVLDITDSATALGQVLAAHTIPLVVFLLLGGVIDRKYTGYELVKQWTAGPSSRCGKPVSRALS